MTYEQAQDLIESFKAINAEDMRRGLTPYYGQPRPIKSGTGAWGVRYAVTIRHASGMVEYDKVTVYTHLTLAELRDSSLVGW